MKFHRSSFATAVCVFILSGCDAGFGSDIEVNYRSTSVASEHPDMEKEVVSAMRSYAASGHLQCDGGSTLPMRCEGSPVHIVAFRTPKGAMVCYGALGIPLESGKFQRRIQELERALNGQEGIIASAGPMMHAMSPACSEGWAAANGARR